MKNIIDDLKQYLKDKEDIALAFVFGSFASDRLTDESDIDIAFLFRHAPNFSEILNINNELAAVVSREIDMVVLNEASPIIRMQVLKNGILIKKKDDVVYCAFYAKTVKEYDDIKYIRREAEENILKGRIYA